MKRNLPHRQNYQKKILHLMYLLKLQKSQESKQIEILQVHNVFNKSTHDEDNTSEDNAVSEFEPIKENGEQNIGKENKLLSTKFQVKIENRKLKDS